ncbi:hypothetical protein An01g05980 [Aspergillus niger]|uniref:Uncharacterized protein n=2 Tax=Aspergillus niger TaxID=5061 RepID=A2Q8Y3_ASPNC|nr:hypothetical protein An01g05980 [Aspergillus niger]CAK37073.1 hypothetical protein An01g05980 [Aspergillus niger]
MINTGSSNDNDNDNQNNKDRREARADVVRPYQIANRTVRTSKDDTRSGLEASIHDDGDEGSTDRALSPGAKWKGEEKKRRRAGELDAWPCHARHTRHMSPPLVYFRRSESPDSPLIDNASRLPPVRLSAFPNWEAAMDLERRHHSFLSLLTTPP